LWRKMCFSARLLRMPAIIRPRRRPASCRPPLRPAGTTPGSFWVRRDDRLVGLDHAAERLALGVDQGAAQLGGQHPGGSIRTQALQLQRRDAVGVRCHQKRRPKPDRQRQLADMHDRASGHRGLPSAIGSFIGKGFGLQQPSTAPATTRADKPFWPTALEEVFGAGALRGKAALKLEQRLGKPSLRSRHDTHPAHPTPMSAAYTYVLVLYTRSGLAGPSCISPLLRSPKIS